LYVKDKIETELLNERIEIGRMPRRTLERIRARIRLGQFDMTAHATEEMCEDDLDIFDVEHALLGGEVVRTEKDDPRGTRYVIEGTAADHKRSVGVVGRFTTAGCYLIITVYEITG